MKLAERKEICCGCTACESVCPVGGDCLKLERDGEGFLYPTIDTTKCISCHACERACFYQTGKQTIENSLENLRAYALKAGDDNLRAVSQSGGAFGVIAQSVLEKNGVVYGAAFDDERYARHIRAASLSELAKIHGSKYVQSDLRKIFIQVKQDIRAGKLVLFSGTACQVMGLRKFLHRSYDNLLLVDIICYGVPSPSVWRDFLNWHSHKEYGSLLKVEHRAKDFGWHKCLTRLTYEHKTVVTDRWNFFWGSALALRPSCYECQFTNLERPGDLTVGDCWGAEKKMPEFDDNRGISLMLVNTQTGLELFKSVQEKFVVRSIDISEYRQPRLLEPTKRPANRESFWQDYANLSKAAFMKKYASYSAKEKVRRYFSKIPFLRKIYHLMGR